MVVIVGGGFAGLETAINLRTLRPGCEVTLVSSSSQLVYKPWLIHVPAGRRSFGDVCIPLAPMAARYGFKLLEGEVGHVELDSRRVRLAGGRGIDYSHLVVATGSTPDRGRIPGAAEHALFPCDPDDAQRFARAIRAARPRSVCIAAGWDRRGPGLEFAAWLAARRRQAGLAEVEIVAVDGDGLIRDRYDDEAIASFREILAERGAELETGGPVESVTKSGVVINGSARDFDLVALVSPSRGVELGLPPEMLDAHGFVRVSDTFETATPGVFAFGDAAALPPALEISKTMVSIRQLAGHLARNVLARTDGAEPKPLEPSRGPRYSMSDLGGTALELKDRHVTGRGRLPLMRRWLYDRGYFRMRS